MATSAVLEDVSFDDCKKAGKAWKHWDGASFPNLKKANFERCFYDSEEGSEFVVAAMATSAVLEDVSFTACGEVENAWGRVLAARAAA